MNAVFHRLGRLCETQNVLIKLNVASINRCALDCSHTLILAASRFGSLVASACVTLCHQIAIIIVRMFQFIGTAEINTFKLTSQPNECDRQSKTQHTWADKKKAKHQKIGRRCVFIILIMLMLWMIELSRIESHRDWVEWSIVDDNDRLKYEHLYNFRHLNECLTWIWMRFFFFNHAQIVSPAFAF